MPHTSANVLVHLIFSTKQRSPLITAEIKDSLFAYMGGIIRELQGAALIVNGMSDHVHLLVRIPPIVGIAEMTRILKANSSRWVHERFARHRAFRWQTG
jgi:putative transposase